MVNNRIHFEEFAERISLEAGFDIDTTKDYLHTLFNTTEEETGKKNWVKVRNFGSFHPVKSKERAGINPQTGERITIPEHYHVHFKPSKHLSDMTNAKYANRQPKEYRRE